MGLLKALFGTIEIAAPRECEHDWEKWSDPRNTVMEESNYTVGYLAVAQYRVCKKCGIADTRKLPNMRSVDGLKYERAKRKP